MPPLHLGQRPAASLVKAECRRAAPVARQQLVTRHKLNVGNILGTRLLEEMTAIHQHQQVKIGIGKRHHIVNAIDGNADV